ncbi:hypothetical protein O3P69_008392 [Scylla paramamosain]|uniref:EGF-like calcium-binding domain-containing protein n=1 Tax=Scylla paramamosain TaxID=85552 RepID=A0AAW0SLA6_SCYPA
MISWDGYWTCTIVTDKLDLSHATAVNAIDGQLLPASTTAEQHQRGMRGTEEAGSKCIQKQCLCDVIKGCSSGEDEMVLPCGIDECREKNGGCGHLCVSTVEPYYYCQCQPGHKLIKKFNCEDIDECVAPGSCFQYCTNTTGGFHCCSQPGYRCHSSNYMHCKADSGNPYLISYRAHMSSPETP